MAKKDSKCKAKDCKKKNAKDVTNCNKTTANCNNTSNQNDISFEKDNC